MAKKKRYSDTELIQALVQPGSMDDAVTFIYATHYRFLAKVVTGNSGNEMDAEDVFQETLITFIQLVQHQKFRGESSVRTFLYSLMRNIWLGELRKRNSSRTRDTGYYEDSERVEKGVTEFLQVKEATQEVFAFFDTLGEACKKLLIQFYYQELPMKMILEESGFENEQVLRNKKYKCMKKLTEMLDKAPIIKERLKTALRNG
jgi:RNA polymerase sigma factor (sigma-70 family)